MLIRIEGFKMYKYLFGPVPSRRLGISLGVDLVTHKICSLDCIYCECGKTTDLTVERKEYVPVDAVMAELEDYFSNHPDPDFITFSGSGEPCLNLRIKDVIDFIKTRKPNVSIAVLTNGTLLNDPEVRKSILGADLVMPSLDGAMPSSLRRINRPHPSINATDYIDGIVAFRNEFHGRLALEIFILPGYNDTPEELQALKAAVERIQPDIIQLNTLDRPGVVPNIHASTRESLDQIAAFFKPFNVEVIAAAPKRKQIESYRTDMESAILETVLRRPCTLEDLATILGTHVNEINKYLAVLEEAGRIESVREARGLFYQARNKFGKE
jgi:wyosine [tRNA(Phe)-imidazoG37] synthetase (radical SAM superfamily)